LEKEPSLIKKPKFKENFPYNYLQELRNGKLFGGLQDTLLLAAVYAYDKEQFKGENNWYVQSRGIFTFFTMESLRLQKETTFSKETIRNFLFELITLIGLPDISFYLDVNLDLAIARSKERHDKKPTKQILEGLFLQEQTLLQQEYEYLLTLLPKQFIRLSKQDLKENIQEILSYKNNFSK